MNSKGAETFQLVEKHEKESSVVNFIEEQFTVGKKTKKPNTSKNDSKKKSKHKEAKKLLKNQERNDLLNEEMYQESSLGPINPISHGSNIDLM